MVILALHYAGERDMDTTQMYYEMAMEHEAYTSLSRRQASSPQKSLRDFQVGTDEVGSGPGIIPIA